MRGCANEPMASSAFYIHATLATVRTLNEAEARAKASTARRMRLRADLGNAKLHRKLVSSGEKSCIVLGWIHRQ